MEVSCARSKNGTWSARWTKNYSREGNGEGQKAANVNDKGQWRFLFDNFVLTNVWWGGECMRRFWRAWNWKSTARKMVLCQRFSCSWNDWKWCAECSSVLAVLREDFLSIFCFIVARVILIIISVVSDWSSNNCNCWTIFSLLSSSSQRFHCSRHVFIEGEFMNSNQLLSEFVTPLFAFFINCCCIHVDSSFYLFGFIKEFFSLNKTIWLLKMWCLIVYMT